MTRHLETFERVMAEEFLPLREAAIETDPTEVSAVARLRRDWPAELVAAALELAAGRARARGKFPSHPDLLADAEGVEQATGERVADHKARRYSALGPRPVVDLCCGIGGDAMALAREHEVVAIDRDPVRAWMCQRNANCRTACAEVESWWNERTADPDALFHLDPARRVEHPGQNLRERIGRFEDYRPGPAFMERLVAEGRDGAIKLGPGVDLGALPWDDAEIELITDGGELVQCVAWFGDLATDPGRRRATVLPEGETIAGEPGGLAAGDGDFGRYLFQANAALERARLIPAVAVSTDMLEIAPGLGLYTGDTPPNSDWLTAYEVLEVLPWRPARIRSWLSRHDAGVTVVKTRGGAVDANRAARELRGEGTETYVVFALRVGKRKMGVICRKPLHRISSTD